MFSEFFCSCFLYPAMYDGAKLGAGKIWSFLSDKKKSGQLSSTDIELYNLIEKVSRKLAGSYSDDSIYSVCEILCNTWQRKRSFGLEDIREALKLIGIAHSKEELVLWKESLDQEIEKNQKLFNSLVRCKLEGLTYLQEQSDKNIVVKKPVMELEENIDVMKDPPIFFTNIGKEKTVYAVVPKKDGLKICIKFEPTRIRPEIPDYGGICCLFSPPVSIVSKQRMKVSLEFLDRNISQITLELKKAGHTEPDDEKKYVIKNQQAGNREYIFDLSDCPVKIKEELSEIVLATDATDFCDENWLYAEILIQQIAFA